MPAPDQDEARSRLRAAIAYRDLGRVKAAAKLSVSPATLDRMTGKRGKETRALTWDDLWQAAAALDLPAEWFSADYERMAEIVTEGPIVKQRETPPIPGETGRRVASLPPTPSRRRRAGSAQAKDDVAGGQR
jgi:hypothetical protein